FRVDDQLGYALSAVERHGSSGRAPREARDLDRAILLLSLFLGEPAPGNFRVSKDHGRYRPRLERHLPAGDSFHGRAPFVGSLVREHRLSRHVANGVDTGLGGPPLEVDFDEAARVDLNLG